MTEAAEGGKTEQMRAMPERTEAACPIRYGWTGQNGSGHYTIRETIVLRIVEMRIFV